MRKRSGTMKRMSPPAGFGNVSFRAARSTHKRHPLVREAGLDLERLVGLALLGDVEADAEAPPELGRVASAGR